MHCWQKSTDFGLWLQCQKTCQKWLSALDITLCQSSSAFKCSCLKGIKQPESELTSAKVPLTVSTHNTFALKLMRHRHSTCSEVRLPALRSEQIRQDNSGFVCLTAARPLRIVQNGENQNQNSGAELDKPVMLLLSPIPVFFHLFYVLASPFPKLMFVLGNPHCICQRSSYL